MQMEERLAKKHKSGKISEADFQEGMKKIKALESSDEGSGMSEMESDFDSSDEELKKKSPAEETRSRTNIRKAKWLVGGKKKGKRKKRN